MIDTQILEKAKAKEKYVDSIASGNGAVLVEEAHEKLCLRLGNLLPEQICKINLTLVQQIPVKDYLCKFQLPSQYFPAYYEQEAATIQGSQKR